MAEPRVVVVGGGIVGLCCAYYLRRGGAAVTVVERTKVGAGSSSGNAGWIVPVLSSPLAGPHTRRGLVTSMARREAPFRVRPTLDPGVWSWLWRFRRSGSPKGHAAGLHALAALNARTMDLYDGLADDGVDFELHRSGVLFAFTDGRAADAELAALRPMARYGFTVPDRALTGSDVRVLEPALSPDVAGGFLVEGERHVVAGTIVRGLTAKLREMDVTVLEGSGATGFDRTGTGRVRAVEREAGAVVADAVVLAAGAWTPAIAATLGVRVPVLAGKGFSFSVAPQVMPARPLYLGATRVACTPLGDRLRVAGTVEVGRIDMRPDLRRLGSMLQAVQAYLAGDGPSDVWEPWVGLRPVAPDGLPVLGLAPGFENVYLATGHSTVGMTLGPASGEAMAELILTGERPDRLRPFSPDRF